MVVQSPPRKRARQVSSTGDSTAVVLTGAEQHALVSGSPHTSDKEGKASSIGGELAADMEALAKAGAVAGAKTGETLAAQIEAVAESAVCKGMSLLQGFSGMPGCPAGSGAPAPMPPPPA